MIERQVEFISMITDKYGRAKHSQNMCQSPFTLNELPALILFIIHLI